MDAKTISYIINELGEERENYFNAVAPPIIQTSNFSFKKLDDMRKSFEDEYSTFLYSRGLNPTVKILSQKLAALDGAEDCLVFNSGAAAIFAAVLANVKSGDHIISVDKPYTWAQKRFNNILPRFNVTTTYIDVPQRSLFDGPEFYIRMAESHDNSNDPVQRILENIIKQGNFLGKITHINQWVVSGCDSVSSRNISKLNNKEIKLNDGIYVLDLENQRDL